MNPLAAPCAAWSVLRSPRGDRSALTRLQEGKLRRIVHHAWRYVPYYRRLFDRVGLDPDTVRSPADLLRLPVTTKRDLLDAGSNAFSRFYRRDELVTHRTTGSTGEPMTMCFDRHFERVRRLVFLRALLAAGYRPGERMLMLKPGDPARAAAWTGLETARFDESPRALFERLGRFQPRVLYGWVTPIRELAAYVREAGTPIAGLRAVITTAEALDGPTRRFFATTFDTDVYDIYGLTEIGTVAWECSRHDGLHLSEDIVLVEPGDAIGTGGESPLIMTSLELTAMPLIRYQTGDVATSPDPNLCACGRTFRRIPQVSGRLVDCLRLPGGRLLSPYTITLALESVQGLNRYQVLQEQSDVVIVRYESRTTDTAMSAADAVRRALSELVGKDVRIDVCREDTINPPAGQKFRVVESRIHGA